MVNPISSTMRAAAFSAALLLAPPTFAQQPAPAPAETDRHAPSGIVLPATLGGEQKTASKDYYKHALDTMTEYRTDDFSPVISVYIFRKTNGTVPIWFERAEANLLVNPLLGNVSVANAARAFTPPRQSVASGMRASYAVTGSGNGYRSSALLLFPVNDWYVKLRLSSKRHSPAELEAIADRVLSGMGFPDKMEVAPLAMPVAPCADALSFAAKPKPVKQSQDDRMMSALLGAVMQGTAANSGESKQAEADAKPVTWCRDASSTPTRGVYRADGEATGYLLAPSDAGRGMRIAADSLGALLKNKKNAATDYQVTLYLPDIAITFPPLDGLASPDALIAHLQSSAPLSSITTWGPEKSNITIPSK